LKRALGLLAVVLVQVGLRAWILATAFDDVSIAVYELSPMDNLAVAGVGTDHDYGAPIGQYYDARSCGPAASLRGSIAPVPDLDDSSKRCAQSADETPPKR
jgi:hypothetical protein